MLDHAQQAATNAEREDASGEIAQTESRADRPDTLAPVGPQPARSTAKGASVDIGGAAEVNERDAAAAALVLMGSQTLESTNSPAARQRLPHGVQPSGSDARIVSQPVPVPLPLTGIPRQPLYRVASMPLAMPGRGAPFFSRGEIGSTPSPLSYGGPDIQQGAGAYLLGVIRPAMAHAVCRLHV